MLFRSDELTDRPLRFLAAELVREAAIEELSQEIPYALAVEIERFDESDPDLVRVDARLLVERDSQKRIVIGAGGERIREIGRRARAKIEPLVGERVYLDLWVKVLPNWRRDAAALRRLGISEQEESTS